MNAPSADSNVAVTVLSIGPTGTITAIYDDSLLPLIHQGNTVTTRASHVEPALYGGEGWTADLSPVGGPRLGPFPTRAGALTAEREWLNTHVL